MNVSDMDWEDFCKWYESLEVTDDEENEEEDEE